MFSGKLQTFGYKLQDLLRPAYEFVEDQWFDRLRHIHTAGNMTLSRAGIAPEEQRDSELYQPARPRNIREALRALPMQDVSGYSYIDLGSGKGRTLFVAADWPFRQVTGVEFSRTMHDLACRNIRTYRWWRRRCGSIASIHGNAADYEFPEGKLVLYMFNPFGAETMQKVLNNLQHSLWLKPRHVVVILLWPQCEEQVARMVDMQLIRSTRRYKIFEAHAPGSHAEPGRAMRFLHGGTPDDISRHHTMLAVLVTSYVLG